MTSLENIITMIINEHDSSGQATLIESATDELLINKLSEVPSDSKYYKCSCGTIIENAVFLNQHGNCPYCGLKVVAIYEHNEDDNKRHICPKCHTSKLFEHRSGSYCKVCGSLMFEHTPFIPKNFNK